MTNPYTPATLAERWQCSEDVVYRLIKRGELPAFKLGGKLYRIQAADVERFECQNIASSATEAGSVSPSQTANEAAFASRLGRMTVASRKLAPVTSGTLGTSPPANA